MDNFRRTTVAMALAVCMFGSVQAIAASDPSTLWQPVNGAAQVARAAGITITPAHYRAFTFDIAAAQSRLALRPGGSTQQSIALPLPEGGFTTFQLSESNVMPAALAARFPSIRSYRGTDPEGRRVRLDVSPQGLTAAVYGDKKGDWLVQPANRLSGQVSKASAGDVYWSFRKQDVPESAREPSSRPDKVLRRPGTPQASQVSGPDALNRLNTALRSGTVLYDFTLAMATDSTYAAHFGGTVSGTLGSLVSMVNRLNEIYERDLGVHFTLSANADKIIYIDPATDPYRGMEAGDTATNVANARNLAKVLGNANFDVGHLVMGGGGGGSAFLSGTCTDGDTGKASASTGRSNPAGDPFVVDYVAHELGHQFGSEHSFNGCFRPTSEWHALEPGSGSTIMGYAGICGVHDLQDNSDAYFHIDSINQIQSWLGSAGGQCAAPKLNQSAAPHIDDYKLTDPRSGAPYTIPARTPFKLSVEGLMELPNPDNVSYTWEQMDSGPQQFYPAALKDDGKGPLFRSYAPSDNPARTFPQMAALLGYEPSPPGEALPTTSRTLTFQVTARDNVPMNLARSTGPSLGSGTMKINVLNTGAAFAIKVPTKTTRWQAGSEQQVTWNVAKTDQVPIMCQTIRIDLSLNGGQTWLRNPLWTRTRNDGESTVRFSKSWVTKQARLRLSCNEQPFFAVSNADFEIYK